VLGQNKDNRKDAESVARYAMALEAQGMPSVRGTDPGSSPEMTHLGHALNTYSF